MPNFKPQCRATAVGAFPHKTAGEALEKIYELLPEMPFWPQLPNTGILEESHVQFSEGLPHFIMEPAKKKGYFDTSANLEEKLQSFESRYSEPDWNYFALSPEYAPGFFTFLENFNRLNPSDIFYVKGQMTGPLSFGLENTDQEKIPIIEHEILFGVIVRGLAMKARWQVRELKKVFPDVALFINEHAFDASLVELEAEHAISALNEVIDGIKEEGAIAGIHVSGACDWPLIMDTHADILGFNAYDHTQEFIENVSKINEFLENGKTLAWGIVPASSEIMQEDALTLIPVFEEAVDVLETAGIDRNKLLEQSMLTATGGNEKLTERESNKVLYVLYDMSQTLREKYFSP